MPLAAFHPTLWMPYSSTASTRESHSNFPSPDPSQSAREVSSQRCSQINLPTRYEGVAADIEAWWPRVKADGGLLVVNDFQREAKGVRAAFPGVARAFLEFAQRQQLQVVDGAVGVPPGVLNAMVIRNKTRDGIGSPRGR